MKLPFQPVPRSKAKGGKVEKSLEDIRNIFGFIPEFVNFITDESISGAWSEFKGLQLNPYTSLNGKQKELIGLAVASQIPCEYCIYFYRAASRLYGATDREIQEAISIAAMARHWSTLFHGMQLDLSSFRKDADRMVARFSGKH